MNAAGWKLRPTVIACRPSCALRIDARAGKSSYNMSMHAMLLTDNAPIESSPLAWREVPDPVPGPGEVRLRVRCCAICRTDLHVIEGDLPRAKMPVIPGHQVVGTVDSLGPGCRRLKIGERVGIAWLRHTCGTCD